MNVGVVVMDVDGTLTDGSIYYGQDDVEIKKFNVKDAAGILSVHAMGMTTMILTGRESAAVEHRARDLRIDYVLQGIQDKETFLRKFMLDKGIDTGSVLYIGDDFNDLPVMRLVGYSGCPADAAEEVRDYVDFIASVKGGYGAVRDVIFQMLKKENLYAEAIQKAYGV